MDAGPRQAINHPPTLRLFIQHRSRYLYGEPTALGPHLIRLRPANHTKAKIESYGLHIAQESELRWQQDPYSNHVAKVTFKAGSKVTELDVLVEMAVDVRPVNPFDFFLDERCGKAPFQYPKEVGHDLTPFFNREDPALRGGPLFKQLLAELPKSGDTVPLTVEINRRVNQKLRYVIREEAGIWTPEETLEQKRGSCRDFAVLLIALLRSYGFAARFASGYLVQLLDEGMLPDQPKGVTRDVVDLHAWAEVYLPGGGWIGLDATSGLLCGEGHIPLACTATPALAAPIEGTTERAAKEVQFELKVARLGHEPRPTAPYEDRVWAALVQAGQAADRALDAAGLSLTSGGEPTFNSREFPAAPEWNAEALGPTKWSQGLRLASELRSRLSPGSAVLRRMGKVYPGESLPRWALDLCGRRDGQPIWTGSTDQEGPKLDGQGLNQAARRLAKELATELGVPGFVEPAYEDPWKVIQDERALPIEVDPLDADLDAPEERRRLARVLDRGLGQEAGYVLPLSRNGGKWVSQRWTFRRGHLFLLPGDSPIGLRLPLGSLSPAKIQPPEPRVVPPDPRRTHEEPPAVASAPTEIRTALCVEARDGWLHVFLPPLFSSDDFFALVKAIDQVRERLGLFILLEGYPPPPSPSLYHFSVTPDPGVLEVNLPPSRTSSEHLALLDKVYDAALHAGLHAEKFLLDGRMAGSGGGNHLTLGGPSALESPFVKSPALLGSLITFVQHHPSLSYLFTGLFVGPTSQAPRLDEARHEALYEMEIALAKAFSDPPGTSPPWLSDALFRHLLVDVAGNTHRTEICIDKLFDWRTPFGRQGLVELRAFEMPPHPRMASAQMILVRSLLAAFAKQPYQAPLVRWGSQLHDRFLLPYWIWRDFEDVLSYLASAGLGLPAEAYSPFLELRCPLAGRLQASDIAVEVRNALEPWHVLGEEPGTSGTSRYVDSSMERVEVRVEGLIPERYQVLVNAQTLPLKATPTSGQFVGGVRFRAWAPPHSLHPHLGIHHPLRFDIVDTWAQRSIGACGYHVWHPEGRAFDTPPLTRFEAAARRAQRFTIEGPLPWPVAIRPSAAHPDAPYTLDLRRYPIDRPMPGPVS